MRTLNWLESPLPADALEVPDTLLFRHVDDGRALAQAIVDTIREPLLVLDDELRVVAANRSFYLTFRMNRQEVQGRPIYALGEGQWDIPELRSKLGRIAPHRAVLDGYEVERDFSGIGRRTMVLNARTIFYAETFRSTILVAIEDVTERRAKEREVRELLQYKDVLLQEMQHRVANSLQIIASIFMIKARTVRSEETRTHLEDAHRRVMAVAAVQQQFQARDPGAQIELGAYLSGLCDALAASIVGDHHPIALTVQAESGTASATQAVGIGLIVTELVINALKHAFPAAPRAAGIAVRYERAGLNWRISVADNGTGGPAGPSGDAAPGLGTAIIAALAQQLDARVDVLVNDRGTTVSVTHAKFSTQPSPVA